MDFGFHVKSQPGSFDVLLQGEDRQQHADENGSDETRDQKEHERLGKRHRRL
jgi:hypothetical protein